MIKAKMTHYNNNDMHELFNVWYWPVLRWMVVFGAVGTAVLTALRCFLDCDFLKGDLYTAVLVFFICLIVYPFSDRILSISSSFLMKRYYITYREGDISFEFSEDSYSIYSDYGNQTDHISGKYTDLLRIQESRDHFFMFIDRKTVHMLRKEAICEGSDTELREILSEALGKKFKTKVK